MIKIKYLGKYIAKCTGLPKIFSHCIFMYKRTNFYLQILFFVIFLYILINDVTIVSGI